MPITGARTVFLYRSRKTGRTAIAWQEGKNWRNFASSGHSSTQRAELFTAIMILWQWPQEHLNIDCDSGYTVYTILHLDQASIKTSIDPNLLNLFVTLQSLLDKQEHPLFITQVGSHSGLPSPLVVGNNKAEALVSVFTAFQQAAASHQFFHQNSQALQKQFDLPRSQAKQIIKECPDCQAFTKASPSTGVNPQGLSSQIICKQMSLITLPLGNPNTFIFLLILWCSICICFNRRICKKYTSLLA